MKDDAYWERKIKQQPERFIPSYTENELVEIADAETGYTWIKNKKGEWVAI